VWMQPSGTVGLVGFATNALFLRVTPGQGGHRGAVRRPRRIQVDGQPVHSGPLHRRAPRGRLPPHRKPAHQVWQAIAASRGIESAVDELADRAPRCGTTP
jgi:protease-4